MFMIEYTAISRKVVGKKSTKVHATRPKGSMGRSKELLHVLNSNEIKRHDNTNFFQTQIHATVEIKLQKKAS